jgi:hypothetical protein
MKYVVVAARVVDTDRRSAGNSLASHLTIVINIKCKGKVTPLQARCGPEGGHS